MTKIEVQGLKLEFDEQAVFDADVADMLYDITSGETIPPVKKLVVACFGKEQYKKIADLLKAETGRVRIDALGEFFAEAMVQANLKNS